MGPDGTLVIYAVRAADVGDYTCMLSSAGGNETRTARLSVIGKFIQNFPCNYAIFIN